MTEEERALAAGIKVARAIVETVRECGGAPSGIVYLALASYGISLDTYHKLLDVLVRTKHLKVENHYLTVPDAHA